MGCAESKHSSLATAVIEKAPAGAGIAEQAQQSAGQKQEQGQAPSINATEQQNFKQTKDFAADQVPTIIGHIHKGQTDPTSLGGKRLSGSGAATRHTTGIRLSHSSGKVSSQCNNSNTDMAGALAGSYTTGTHNPSDERVSLNSTASALNQRQTNSARSSFAALHQLTSTRSSFAVDTGVVSTARNRLLRGSGSQRSSNQQPASQSPLHTISLDNPVPQHLTHYCAPLVIVPPDTPIPAAMLQRLWQLGSLQETLEAAEQLRAAGVLRVAMLDDGSSWCLLSEPQLAQLQVQLGCGTPEHHAALLDSYCNSSMGGAPLQVHELSDDGYITQQLAYHLVGAGRLHQLRQLLGEPTWLEAKLHAYGTAPVVGDFRRYLNEVPDDSGAKLLLQALQLSLGCCTEQPNSNMLREQMLARLVGVAHAGMGGQQHHHHPHADGRPSGSPPQQGLRGSISEHMSASDVLVPAVAVYDGSEGGVVQPQRSSRSRSFGSPGHSLAVRNPADGSLDVVTGTLDVRASNATVSYTSRASNAAAQLREWWETQSSKAAADMCLAAGYTCVHLLPRSVSLKQAGGVQRMLLRGHAGPVRKVMISPNGQDVITVSEDGSVQVWDMNVGDCVMQLARQEALSDVCVAPNNGMLCAVASVDGAACIWDLGTGVVQHVLRGHTAKVNAVRMDARGELCITASDDHTLRVWSVSTGQCRAVLAGHGGNARYATGVQFGVVFDVALSDDGALAVSVSDDFTARVWDLEDFSCQHVLEGHSGWVVSVCFIGHTTRIITASHDETARVWDTVRGVCLHTLSGHTGRIGRVTCDPNGLLAVTCSDDDTARIWDLSTGQCKSVLTGHNAWVADAVITRDGRRCVTAGGDGLVCVWNAATGALQCQLEGHSAPLRSVVLTMGGRFAVTAGDDATAFVWDLAAIGRELQQAAHKAKVRGLCVLPGGRQVVSSGEDGAVMVWDVGSCKVERTLEGHTRAVAYLGMSKGQGKTVVVAGSGDRRVVCWDAATGSVTCALPAQQGSRVKDMAFSTDGMHAAVVLYDSSVAVWDVQTGQITSQLIGRGERVGRNVHSGGVNGVMLCADGSTAVTWSKDCTARVWDVATATVRTVCEGHTDGIAHAALAEDESILATASYGNCVRLHLMSDGSPLAVLDHAAPATHLTFSPTGRLLAVALEDHTVVVWDLVAHSCLPPLAAHKRDITGMAFSPDGSMLATCSQDATLRVWDGTTGRQVAFFVADATLSTCCFAGGAPGGGGADIIVVGDVSGAVHFLDFPPELQPGVAAGY